MVRYAPCDDECVLHDSTHLYVTALLGCVGVSHRNMWRTTGLLLVRVADDDVDDLNKKKRCD